MLLVFRFLAGLRVRAEWSNGTSLVAETWSQRARPTGLGLLQSGYGWGQLVGTAVWFSIAGLSPEAWRYLFFIGVLPTLFVIYIRRTMEESEMWGNAAERESLRRERESGAELGVKEEQKSRFTLSYLFADGELRSRLLFATALSLATVVGFWAISTWIPSLAQTLAEEGARRAPNWPPASSGSSTPSERSWVTS
jgi:hypothetical protein